MRIPVRPKKYQKPMGWHVYKPDVSNLLKFIEDTCTGILFHDDCIIASVLACKRYDIEPRTELIITELSNE